MMREHVPQETRIHYVITNGGGMAPNVVPNKAEVFYYFRNPDYKSVFEIFDRAVEAAKGAAMGTGTRMEYEVIHGIHSLLPNTTLSRVVQKNFEAVGGVKYNDEEMAFAKKLQESLKDKPNLNLSEVVAPFQIRESTRSGSTDVGDVSWNVPTIGLRTATWVPGTPSHSWQAVASGGTSIGIKGMMVAAKALAFTAIDLYENTNMIKEARKEFDERRGPGYVYKSLLGDRKPPLDYRKK